MGRATTREEGTLFSATKLEGREVTVVNAETGVFLVGGAEVTVGEADVRVG